MYRQYGGGFTDYVSVAEKKKKAEKAATKLIKSGRKISPVRIEGRKIASSFWGKAWCDHLESFSDYESRLPRGRSYVRNGSVLDLKVKKGKVTALVQGTSLYKLTVDVATLPSSKWDALCVKCAGEIGSVIELLQGKLSSSVMKTVADKKRGLFPMPKEITLQCSCPDWAEMCKHVAAALYGIGARLDKEPELLFVLRNVDYMELIDAAALPGKTVRKSASQKTLAGQDLSALFGIGHGLMYPAMAAYSIQVIPGNLRAMTIWTGGFIIGVSIGAALGGVIAEKTTIGTAFMLSAVMPMLAVAILSIKKNPQPS